MIPELFSTCGGDDLFCRIGIGLGLFAAFLVFWLAMMFLVAAMGGWRKLAEKYALPEDQAMPDGRKHGWKSAALRGRFPTSYNNCLNFYTCAEGLGIAPVWLFSFGHAPLFIPWPDVALTDRKSLFGNPVNIQLGDSGYVFVVWAKFANIIRAAKPQ